jgi:hypothetical protein
MKKAGQLSADRPSFDRKSAVAELILPAIPAAAVASAAATTATTTVTTSATTTAAATATGTFLLRSCFIDLHRPAIEVLAVEAFDRRIGLSIRRHLDEAESLAATGIPIRDHLGRVDAAKRAELVGQALIGC